MGGLVCGVHRFAVLRFDAVPIQPSAVKEFDKQIRELYNAPTIAESVVNEVHKGEVVCPILAKQHFTPEDRQTLLDVIESLYEIA